MSDKIRIAARPNEVTIVYDIAAPNKNPQFAVRVRTAKNSHINATVSLSDIKALSVWLAKRIAAAEEPQDGVSENQLDMFQI